MKNIRSNTFWFNQQIYIYTFGSARRSNFSFNYQSISLYYHVKSFFFFFQVFQSLNHHLYTDIIVSVHLCRTPLACHFDCFSIEHLQYVIFHLLLCNKRLVNIDCDSRIVPNMSTRHPRTWGPTSSSAEFYCLNLVIFCKSNYRGTFWKEKEKKNMQRMFIEEFNFRSKK